MKTLQQSIDSLSNQLHDSGDMSIAKKHFYHKGRLFDQPVRQEGGSYIVSVPVPGYSKEDLLVYTDGKLLSISSKQPVQAKKQNGSTYQGGLNYSFVLPQGIDTNGIKAKCRNGLLTITLDKEKRSSRSLTIKVDGMTIHART